MSTQGEAANGIIDRGTEKPTRPFFWSVRREIWENRSVYWGPIAVAGVILFGFIVTAGSLPGRRQNTLAMTDALRQRAAVEMPYDLAAVMIMVTAFIVGIFYCLDALYGERKDRSILFWKSLPVSDVTTVLSKIFIPLAVLPAIAFAIIVSTQMVMLAITSVVLLFSGISPGTTFQYYSVFDQTVIGFYSVVASSLWHVPTFSWMLLVSGWARRAAFLWAVLPALAISFFERIVFGTHYFAGFIKYRFTGWADTAFTLKTGPSGHPVLDSLSQLTPGQYLITPGLWLGLLFAAVCLIAAVRLRRYRGPV